MITKKSGEIRHSVAIVIPAKPGRLKKVPTLKNGDDAKAAAELEQYIVEAESGLRSILKAGFFLECIADGLKRGQLGPWVEAHCKSRTWRTIQRWKQVSAALGDAIGIKYKKRIGLKLHEILALPLDQVPEAAKAIREKLDTEIAGKSYRQIFMEFKQADEETLTPKKGRRKGEGGATREQRAAAAEREEAARIEEIADRAEEFSAWLDDNCDDKNLGLIDDKVFEKFADRIEAAWGFCKRLRSARKG